MTDRQFLLGARRWPRPATVLCLAACSLMMVARRAQAQAVSPGTYPIQDAQPADQPLAGQQLGTSLSLNQGVQSISAENESFSRFGFGLEASGGAMSNFFGTQTNPKTAALLQFSAQGALRLRNGRTHYLVMYVPEYNVYPQYSDVNNYSQRFYQILTHQIDERSGIEWSTTAARYLSVNSYLPQYLAIGGVGVVSPTLGAALKADSFEITNGATSLRYRFLLTTKMTFTAKLTAGYFLTFPVNVANSDLYDYQRDVSGGADLLVSYDWSPRDEFGVELTPLYIYGIQPAGHVVSEAVQATYRRQITQTLQARVAAGPLFVQASSHAFPGVQDTSYAVSAALTRQVRQAQFSLAFNRAFIINLLSPALLSNGLNFTVYQPLQKRWIITGAATYFEESGTGVYGSINLYGGQAQAAYQVSSNFQLFGRYSVSNEQFDRQAEVQAFAFTRNQFTGGVRFNLGNPTSGGMQ